MIRTLRRILILLAGTLGIAAATTAPAYAGVILQNHSEPLIRARLPR